MKTLWLIIFLLFSPLFAIVGNYRIQGYDPYSRQYYSGKAVITEDQNGVYQARWKVRGRVYQGTGLREGNRISFLFMLDDHSISGVEVYTIEGNTLRGSFVALGGHLIGQETLTLAAEKDLN